MKTSTSEPGEAASERADHVPPTSPDESRQARGFYYGWVILGVAMMVTFMSGPGQSYSVAAFIDPMLADLKLLRSEYSLAYLVATLVSGATLPFVGRLLDALGSRRLLPLNAILLGLACLGMAGVRHLAELYLGMSFVRCLGQGALTLTGTWMVGQWFERRRGLAMGLLGLGSTLSFMVFPAGNNWLIGHYGWRTAWVVLGCGVWGLLGVPAFLLVRSRPEDLGVDPDRRIPSPSPTTSRSSASTVTSYPWNARQACRTATFWQVVSALATSAMVSTGLVFHQVSLLSEHGVSKSAALGLLSVQAFVACVVSVVGGYLADHIPPRRLLSASMILMALAIILLLLGVRSPLVALAYSILLGLHMGVQRCSGSVLMVNYFGRVNFGAINGIAMCLVVGAAALGPLPLALVKDYTGRYDLALMGLLFFPLASALAVWSAEPPRPPELVSP